jgi:death on curing protein
VRYLTLAEALVVAEAVTGLDTATLVKVVDLGLLDSALHAPQAGFAGHELYPTFVDKAAVLAVRIARNHPLPDGNTRLAWGCLTLFCALNGHDLVATTDDAVAQVLAVAAGQVDEPTVAAWITERITAR